VELPYIVRRLLQDSVSVALAAILVLEIAAIVFAVTQRPFFATPSVCTAAAVRELPSSTVHTVESQYAQYEAETPADGSGTILTRNLGHGWQAVASVTFMPEYCGYIGTVGDTTTTPAALSSSWSPPFSAFTDTVTVLRDGKPADTSTVICISNTVPVAKMTHGHIAMVFKCDREYPTNTWMQPQPKL